MSDSTSPTRPTTNSTVPAVWMLNPFTWAVTAHFRIAPTAIRMMLVPIVMGSGYPTFRLGYASGMPAVIVDCSTTERRV